MTVKVIIIDPDIAFTVPIKRALEISGDYKVNVFANAKAALELLERGDKHDVAIIDFHVGDMPLPVIIAGIHRAQPWIFVLVSPRNDEQAAQVPSLNVEGSIRKPYFARRIAPVIREAALNRARQSAKFLTEPSVQPDDTFRTAVETAGGARQIPATTSAEEPPIPDDATVRELVSGQAPEIAAPLALASETAPETLPETIPETPQATTGNMAAVAEIALEVASDDSVSLSEISKALAEKVESIPPADRPPLPPWIPATGDDQVTLQGLAQNTQEMQLRLPPMLDEPEFVTRILNELSPQADEETVPLAEGGAKLDLNEVFASGIDSDEDEGLESAFDETYDEEFAATFAGLLPQETGNPPLEPLDEKAGAKTALAILGVENLDELEAAEEPEVSELLTSDEAAPAAPSDPVAAMALLLTQLTVESAAQISVLSKGNVVVGMTGLLSDDDTQALLGEIGSAWHGTEGTSRAALFRYVQLPGGGDYLMYSMPTVEHMILTMLFPGDIPLRTIRRQAKQLLDALENVPEPEAARTLLSRPTELRPPPGLHEALSGPSETPETVTPVEPSAMEEPPQIGPYSGYTFVWLPREEKISPELASLLVGWLHNIARDNRWKVEGAEIQPAYVTVQIRIPAAEGAVAVVETLMRETAAQAHNESLWAAPYYIVTSGRAITQQEIASFIEFRQESV